MKIILAGETYSENLGDGVISDSIEYLIKKYEPNSTVIKLDISGRSCYAKENKEEEKESYLSTVKQKFKNKSLIRAYRQVNYIINKEMNVNKNIEFNDANCVIIGGGQLIMDNNLNFPSKINFLGKKAEKCNIPTVFYACGVGEGWSFTAKKMIKRHLIQSDFIFVRDKLSANNLRNSLKIDREIEQTYDPALWAAECYSIKKTENEKRTIGLGITAVEALQKRTTKDFYIKKELVSFWVDLAKKIYEKGFEIKLFTNGEIEDQNFAYEIAFQIEYQLNINNIPILKRPIVPRDLVKNISSFDYVIAFRLHACIIASSLEIPVIGLSWDEKVKSFFKSIGKASYCFPGVIKNQNKIIETLLYSNNGNEYNIQLLKAKKDSYNDIQRLISNYK